MFKPAVQARDGKQPTDAQVSAAALRTFFTCWLSTKRVTMTITALRCCQAISQKSSQVRSRGPCKVWCQPLQQDLQRRPGQHSSFARHCE